LPEGNLPWAERLLLRNEIQARAHCLPRLAATTPDRSPCA